MAKKGVINNKQKKFVTEYLIDFNGTQAAIRAGYSKKTATAISQSLLKQDCVKEYLEKMINEMTSERIASAVEVLEHFTKVMRGEELASVLALDGNRHILMMKPPDHRERLDAAKYLGKFHQLFTEKISVDGAAKIVFNGESDLKD